MKAEAPALTEEKRLATWGSEVPEDLVLDEKRLADALQKVNSLIQKLPCNNLAYFGRKIALESNLNWWKNL